MSSNPHCQVFHFLRDRWFQFAKLEKLHLTISKNPWANHPKCPGSKFYEDVLSRRPATVEEAVRLGKHFGLSEDDVQFHLLWLYTDNKNPLEITGKPFSREVIRVDRLLLIVATLPCTIRRIVQGSTMQSRITGTEVAQILSDCTDSWIEPKPAAVTEGKLI